MRKTHVTLIRATAILFLLAATTRADGPLTIDVHTLDCGGGVSGGGAFELSGTIAQPDAGVLGGGAFELVGGFWSDAAPDCVCPGDMNQDGNRDALDIQRFADCLLGGGDCQCADIDGTDGITMSDTQAFVDDLLSGAACN